MSFRKSSFTIALILCILMFAGIAVDAAKLQKVSIVLDWYPNAVHSFLYAALEKGYFAEEGLDVVFKMPAGNPTDGIKLVGAGRETFALYYQPDILMARVNEGIPVVSIASVVREPLNGIMVPQDSAIASPKDLEGKRVGYPSIPLNISMVKTMVTADGGDFSKVKMTDIGWDLIPAIALKRVAAVSGAFINHEYPIFENEGHPMKYFSPSDFGVPRYHELMLITGDRTAENEELIRAFWRAATRGFEFVKDNPQEGLRILLDHERGEFPLEKSVEEFSLNYLLPRMESATATFGSQTRDNWEEVANWLLEHEMLERQPNLDEMFINIVQ